MADAISYGFPSSERFASAFVPSSLVKEKDVVRTWSIHSLPERSTLLQIFFFFYVLHTLLFIDGFFSPLPPNLVSNMAI